MNRFTLFISIISLVAADQCVFNTDLVSQCSQEGCAWLNPDIWSSCATNGFPSNNDDVTISGGWNADSGAANSFIVTSSPLESIELNSLFVGDNVQLETEIDIAPVIQSVVIQNTSLTLASDLSGVAYQGQLTLDLQTGTMRGKFTVSGTGRLSWTSGQIDGEENLYNIEQGEIDITGSDDKELGVNLYNWASLNVHNVDNLQLYGAGNIYNYVNGSVTIGSSTLSSTNPGNTFFNNGTLTVSDGNVNMDMAYIGSGDAFVWGQLETSGIFNSKGSVTVGMEASLTFDGTTYISGDLQVSGGSVTASDTLYLSGDIDTAMQGQFVVDVDGYLVGTNDGAATIASSDSTGIFTNQGSIMGNLNLGSGLTFDNYGTIDSSASIDEGYVYTNFLTLSPVTLFESSVINFRISGDTDSTNFNSESSVTLGGTAYLTLGPEFNLNSGMVNLVTASILFSTFDNVYLVDNEVSEMCPNAEFGMTETTFFFVCDPASSSSTPVQVEPSTPSETEQVEESTSEPSSSEGSESASTPLDETQVEPSTPIYVPTPSNFEGTPSDFESQPVLTGFGPVVYSNPESPEEDDQSSSVVTVNGSQVAKLSAIIAGSIVGAAVLVLAVLFLVQKTRMGYWRRLRDRSPSAPAEYNL